MSISLSFPLKHSGTAGVPASHLCNSGNSINRVHAKRIRHWFFFRYYWNGGSGVDLNNSIINRPFSILEVVTCAVNLLFCNVECTYWFSFQRCQSNPCQFRASSSASSAGSTTLLPGPYVSRHCLIVSSRSLVIVVIC